MRLQSAAMSFFARDSRWFYSNPTIRRGVLNVLVLISAVILDPLTAADIDRVREADSVRSGYRPLVAADRVATPILAPASKEGEIRLKQFKVAPGLKVELWAAEPMLANPVAFSVDEQGRVFTSETYRYRSSVLDIRHYMFMLEDDLASRSLDDRLKQIRKWFGPDGERLLSQETEVIRMLTDTNGDGRADQSTVFADGFNSPLDGIASGVLARRGEVWVTDIPSLWRFRSGNGDSSRDASTGLKVSNRLASSPRAMRGFVAEELQRGFGVRFSFTGHDLHGLKFGPDGRLYFSCGDRGARLLTKEGKTIDLPDEGAVFRCEPDGSNLEVVHRGLRNPQELAFDEYGNLFTGDNDSDQGDRERWVLIQEGADSGWRVGHQHAPLGNAGMWNLERLWVPHFEGQAAYVMPPIANLGDGPSGIVYDYAGTYSGSQPRTGLASHGGPAHRFLMAYFKGTSAKSGIYSVALRANGAAFELVDHQEFVWNSLVPDVDIGPDGAVWFADWHEGWPKSNKGRIYRAFPSSLENDPIAKETQRLLAEGLSQRGAGELLALLTHPDMRVRQEAQFELAARGTSSYPGLRDVALTSPNLFARLHAMWGIGQLARVLPLNAFVEELAALKPLLSDSYPEVRAQAARLLGSSKLLSAAQGIASLTRNSSERVRFMALQALGDLLSDPRVGRVNRSDGGSAGKMQDTPLYVGFALLKSQPPTPQFIAAGQQLFNTPELIERAFQVSRSRPQDSKLFSLSAVVAARRMEHPSASLFLESLDPLVQLEAARAINDLPIVGALPALAAMGQPGLLDKLLHQFSALTTELHPPRVRISPGAIRDVRVDQPLPWTNAPIDQLAPMLLRIVNANFRLGTPETAVRLAALTVRKDLPEQIRSEAVFALASWSKPAQRDRVTGNFRPLAARDATPARDALRPQLAVLFGPGSSELQIAAADAVARLELREAAPELKALLGNRAASVFARAKALRSLAILKSDGLSDALILAAADPSETLRLEASKLNAELNPNDAAGALVAKLTSGSIAEQQSAFESLGDLKSESADAILADWLDRLMKREVANEVMLDLVEAASKRTATAVQQRLTAYNEWKLPNDHLTPFRETLTGGDAERGKKVFYERQEVACTRCHKIDSDAGGDVGPNLAGITTRATAEHVLESIVFPNQQIADGFESVLLTLKNGTTYAGVLKSETAIDLVVNSPEDGLLTLKKSEISTRERGLSGMPDGMGQLLSRRDLRDLLQFLGTLR